MLTFWRIFFGTFWLLGGQGLKNNVHQGGQDVKNNVNQGRQGLKNNVDQGGQRYIFKIMYDI